MVPESQTPLGPFSGPTKPKACPAMWDHMKALWDHIIGIGDPGLGRFGALVPSWRELGSIWRLGGNLGLRLKNLGFPYVKVLNRKPRFSLSSFRIDLHLGQIFQTKIAKML